MTTFSIVINIPNNDNFLTESRVRAARWGRGGRY